MPVMVIEFFGMPGAGKSYLCARVYDALQHKGWHVLGGEAVHQPRVIRVARKILPVIHEFWASASSRKLAFLALSAADSNMERRVRSAFNALFVRSQIRAQIRTSGRILLLDQGCAQALWSAAWPSGKLPDGWDWSTITSDLRCSFLVIDICVSKELAADRTASREVVNSPVDGRAQSEWKIEQAWAVTRFIHEALVEEAELSEIDIVSVSGDTGEEELQSLVAQIELRLNDRRVEQEALV